MTFRIVKKTNNPPSGRSSVRSLKDIYRVNSGYFPGEDALFRFGGRVKPFMQGAGEVDDPAAQVADASQGIVDYSRMVQPGMASSGLPSFGSAAVTSVPQLSVVGNNEEVSSLGLTSNPSSFGLQGSLQGALGSDGRQIGNAYASGLNNAEWSYAGGNYMLTPGGMGDWGLQGNTVEEGVAGSVEEEEEEQNPAVNGNVSQSMSMPYYGGADLGSRAAMLGQSIGRMGQGNAGMRTSNAAQGIFSTIALGMGLARNIYGAAASERARQKDIATYRQDLAKERKNSFVQYTEEGGDVHIGNGQVFNTGSLTGEYIYPLPKSVEDAANVEVEKGEYIMRPDVTGPMEAKGHRHSDGGTFVDLPDGTHVLSDYRKITPELVMYLSDNYGIKASVKDTYSSVMDKYKKKIGLKDLYDEQEKVYRRLQKVENIKDANTSELSKSVLSGYIAENQTKIDELEPRFRDFGNMLYEAQEADKNLERIDAFFRDGGKVDADKVSKMAKKAKIDEKRARELVYDRYRLERRKMAEGGPTEEDLAWARRQNELINRLFGRGLTFGQVNVEGTDDILNEGTELAANQGYQRTGADGRYGRATAESVGRLANVNRWGRSYLDPNNLDVEGFQTGYNRQGNMLYALAMAGALENADEARRFRDEQGFWGESAGAANIGRPGSAQNSFAVDGKYGQTTATRPYYSLDVLTPEQRRLLNEKDIRNFVDLFGENAEEAKRILGDDYAKFEQLRGDGESGWDFVLGEYVEPEEESEEPQQPTVVRATTLGGTPARVVAREQERQEREPEAPEEQPNQPANSGSSMPIPMMFPEMLREFPGGIITPALERHQAPRIDPVLQSADQYIAELNRATSAQLDALGDVPDSQRASILANMNAIAGTNIGNYINQVNYANAQQRNYANAFNTQAYVDTDDKNIKERQQYEAGVLQAMAIDDENRARFWDSVNDERQKKFNVATSLNTIASIAPDFTMLPSGQVVYTGSNEFGVTPGDYSTGVISALNDRYSSDDRRRRTSTTTATTLNGRNGGRF